LTWAGRRRRIGTYNRWEAAGSPPSGEHPGEGEDVGSGTLRYASDPPLAGVEGDIEAMAMYAGQSVGSITAVEPAAAIVERFAAALGNA
jgi:nitronate monooxygenase